MTPFDDRGGDQKTVNCLSVLGSMSANPNLTGTLGAKTKTKILIILDRLKPCKGKKQNDFNVIQMHA